MFLFFYFINIPTILFVFIIVSSYERLKMDECSVNSSRNRKERSLEMKPPANIEDLFEMAYDTQNKNYPIFRTISNSGYSVNCLATGRLTLCPDSLKRSSNHARIVTQILVLLFKFSTVRSSRQTNVCLCWRTFAHPAVVRRSNERTGSNEHRSTSFTFYLKLKLVLCYEYILSNYFAKIFYPH